MVLSPSSFESAPNGSARFYCFHMFTSTDAVVIWLVNDAVWNGTYPLDCGSVKPVAYDYLEILEFMNISLTCNITTRVKCLVNAVMSNEALLVILSESLISSMYFLIDTFCLGELPPVSNLSLTVEDSTLSLTWIMPPLDITGRVPPDIVYFIRYAGTSNVTRNVTFFEYELGNNTWCHNYTFSVTPIFLTIRGSTREVFYLQDNIGGKFLSVYR